MNYFAFDTSALIKCYRNEAGTANVLTITDALFMHMPQRIITSRLIVAESVSVLKRKANIKALTETELNLAIKELRREMLLVTSIILSDQVADGCHSLILTHNINSADAMFLYQALQVSQILGQSNHRVWLVASDARLLRAADKEGLAILDPESADGQFAETLL